MNADDTMEIDAIINGKKEKLKLKKVIKPGDRIYERDGEFYLVRWKNEIKELGWEE